MTKPQQTMRGFTLFEVSIVLVIIGLVVGGILVGQDLIRAANRAQLISDVRKLETNVAAFRLKYGALPGDIENAYVFFGGEAACGADNTPGSEGCNGDGNNKIDSGLSVSGNREHRQIWAHMKYGGFYPGLVDSTGVGGTGNCNQYSICPPLTALNNDSYYNIRHRSYSLQSGGYITPEKHTIHIKKQYIAGTYPVEGSGGLGSGTAGAMHVTDAYAIDTKIDDGVPFEGSVFVYKYNTSGARCAYNNAWRLTESETNCEMFIHGSF